MSERFEQLKHNRNFDRFDISPQDVHNGAQKSRPGHPPLPVGRCDITVVHSQGADPNDGRELSSDAK